MSSTIKRKGKNNKPIGVYGDGGIIYLFYKSAGDYLLIEKSTDGKKFTLFKEKIKILISGVPFPLKDVTHLSISRIFDNYFLSFKTETKNTPRVYATKGKDFNLFHVVASIEGAVEEGTLIPNYQLNGRYVFLSGGGDIRALFSEDFFNWEQGEKPIIEAHEDFFGENPLKAGNAFLTDEGVLFIYFVIKGKNNLNHFEIKALVLDKNNPTKIIRNIKGLIWESPDEWIRKDIVPLGIVKTGDNYISFWKSEEGVYTVSHPSFLFKKEKKQFPQILLERLKHNPIIEPLVENFWESKATLNPTALVEKDKVHIIYRAIGDDDVSVLGYAASFDGLNIDERLSNPIYTPTQPFESSGPYRGSRTPGKFASGGGCWGGCEDPRITKIDDKLYMTYVAYDGWNPPRIAFTSINVDDFNDRKWNWGKPVLISKPGAVDKNACILPDKINGKYAIFHRIFPDILIDFVDDLNFDGNTFLKGEHKISPRNNFWDSRKIGVGPPPIKTDEGYLMIYQAVGERDPGRYKMGAMLLDDKDATKVIARSREPILSPDMWYENDGHKAGVVYPCGAVTMENKLIVYYGGADTVVCAATARLDEFVHNLKRHKEIKLSPDFASHLS